MLRSPTPPPPCSPPPPPPSSPRPPARSSPPPPPPSPPPSASVSCLAPAATIQGAGGQGRRSLWDRATLVVRSAIRPLASIRLQSRWKRQYYLCFSHNFVRVASGKSWNATQTSLSGARAKYTRPIASFFFGQIRIHVVGVSDESILPNYFRRIWINCQAGLLADLEVFFYCHLIIVHVRRCL